jgi:hypothetical protein
MENAAVHAGKLHQFFHSHTSWVFPEWRAVVSAGASSPCGGLPRGEMPLLPIRSGSPHGH